MHILCKPPHPHPQALMSGWASSKDIHYPIPELIPPLSLLLSAPPHIAPLCSAVPDQPQGASACRDRSRFFTCWDLITFSVTLRLLTEAPALRLYVHIIKKCREAAKLWGEAGGKVVLLKGWAGTQECTNHAAALPSPAKTAFCLHLETELNKPTRFLQQSRAGGASGPTISICVSGRRSRNLPLPFPIPSSF